MARPPHRVSSLLKLLGGDCHRDALEYAVSMLSDDDCYSLLAHIIETNLDEWDHLTYEVTIRGYDPNNSDTDRYVSWIAATSQSSVEAYLFRKGYAHDDVKIRQMLRSQRRDLVDVDIILFASGEAAVFCELESPA